MSVPAFATKVGSVSLKTPLLAASGTWAYGLEFLDHPIQNVLAAFVTKSLSLKPSQGNPMPRLYETDAGLLNSIGLQNMGIEAFIKDVEPKLKAASSPYILSIYANKKDDFAQLAERTHGVSALGVELNISCPNIDKGGLEFSSDPKTTEKLVKDIAKRLNKPLWVKLSPNVTCIQDMAKAAEAGGAEALSLINTLVGMAINVDSKQPWLGKTSGGLSGPAIRPVAVHRVFQVYKAVKIPIVGMGGITCARDVLEFMMAGACAVQVGTWNFRKPDCYFEIQEGLRKYIVYHSVNKLSDLVGIAHNK